jgi:spore coat polysaccharide biosynthesis predicted glycosyltransferase SpsG
LGQLQPAAPLVAALKRHGNEWIEADAPAGAAEDLEEITQEIRRIRPVAVVVDSPNCGPDYLAEVVTLGPLVVTIDSSAPFRFPNQLVVNPTLNIASSRDYDYCPGTQLLYGQRFAVVRSEVRRMRPIRAQEPPEPARALVAFGDDPTNMTSRVTKLLLANNKLARIDIIARPQHEAVPKWQALAEEHKGRVSVAIEPNEVALKISRCHFALCDANSWALEFACVGVPTILIVQDEVYWPTAQRLEEEGASICLGWHEAVTDSTIRQATQTLASDGHERRAMARVGRALVDGRGLDRLVTALEILLHPSRKIDVREAA